VEIKKAVRADGNQIQGSVGAVAGFVSPSLFAFLSFTTFLPFLWPYSITLILRALGASILTCCTNAKLLSQATLRP